MILSIYKKNHWSDLKNQNFQLTETTESSNPCENIKVPVEEIVSVEEIVPVIIPFPDITPDNELDVEELQIFKHLDDNKFRFYQ